MDTDSSYPGRVTTNAEVWAAVPADLRDIDVVAVAVIGLFQVRVTHRDGTVGVHDFDPDEFVNDFVPLRDPATFATAQLVDGHTLGWIIGGVTLDQAPDALWLHAHGICDGSCGRPQPAV